MTNTHGHAELSIGESDFVALERHLFQPDRDEHAAVVLAGVHRGNGRVRLLTREVHLVPEEHFVEGTFGYKKTSARFVAEIASRAADQELAYVAVHSHPGALDRNALSRDDVNAHQRLFPHLLNLTKQQPVAGIALGERSAAGEVWLEDGARLELGAVRVVGHHLRRLMPRPINSHKPDPRFDRQVRLFGDAGQQILRDLHVGVIGAGGGGSMIVEQLAHLGVGKISIVDYDIVKSVNLSRVVGATPSDVGAKKIVVAERLIRTIDPLIAVVPIDGDIADLEVAEELLDTDFLFLATDTTTSRLVFNAITHRYLIPGIQVGAKVDVAVTGEINQVYVAVRPVVPDAGCLDCHSLIDPMRLQEESRTDEEQVAQNYLNEPEVIDPSVVSLNGITASHAVTTMLFMVTGLADPSLLSHRLFLPREGLALAVAERRRPDCTFCSRTSESLFALGDPASSLPCRTRTQPESFERRESSIRSRLLRALRDLPRLRNAA